MEKIEFIESLKTLVVSETPLKVSREVSELKQKFEDFLIEEERLRQVALLEEGLPIEELKEVDLIKEEFHEIFRKFSLRKKDAIELKNEIQNNNLKEKRALITKLSSTIQNEENIGAAFGAFKEIHDKWKETGDIPREKRDDIQAEYSKLLESFFYNMKIYKELKEHDLHRNHQLKLDLIQKVKDIISLPKIKDIETQLKSLQNEWEEIGPVPEEQWESVKEDYWASVKLVYVKIKEFYDKRREEGQLNLDAKKKIIAALRKALENSEELSSASDWDKKTKEVIAFQEKWKTIGQANRKLSDELWKEFRGECDKFFETKKAFYDKLKEKSSVFVDQKKAIIQKAIALQTSADWKETANQLKNFQQQWSKIGHAGQKTEQKLWSEFRGACDKFFNARQAHFDDKDKENEANLTAKQSKTQELSNLTLPSDKKQALEVLKNFSNDFNAIGHVPMKAKDKVFKGYKEALDKQYASLNLAGKEKENILFEVKVEAMKASPDAYRLLDREKQEIRKSIDSIQQEIIQIETNLGFFGRSKGAEEMKLQYEKKIEERKESIVSLKQKLKSIPNE
ncbi:MAG: hypothetical protein ACI9XP_001032 [Lentimonas sp.]|jgi:hypothetical protein